MSDPVEAALRLVKPQIRELGAYTLRHFDPEIKLNQNENPFDVPAELKRRLWERIADRPWNRYPPFVASDFIAAVSEATGWVEDGILVGNGSNELILALLATVVGPDTQEVIPEPTFTLYRLLTGVGGGQVAAVPLTEDLRFDVDAIIDTAARNDAAMTILCTPNNPTGSALSREDVERIHDNTAGLVVLDQAYFEFGGFNALELLKDRPRLVILRTFSKAMALAGLRAGYLLGHPALVTEFAKAKLPYNLNFATETIAAEVLRARHLLQPNIELIRQERDALFDALDEMDTVQAYPSAANFVLFRVQRPGIDHREVFQRLLDEYGVLVRDVSNYPMLDGCLRVTAGAPAENARFLEGIRWILGQNRPA